MAGVFFQHQFMAVDVDMTLNRFERSNLEHLDENVIKTLISSTKNRYVDVVSKKVVITPYLKSILFGFK